MDTKFMAGRGVLLVKKYSPQILTAVGIGAGVTSTVLAVQATPLANLVIMDHKALVALTKEHKNDGLITDKEYGQELGRHYAKTGWNLFKLYGPAISIGAAGIACHVSALGIMQKRNAAMTAAYVAVEKTLKEYRQRVQNELGVQSEADLYNRVESTEEVETEEEGTVRSTIVDPTGVSGYAKFFDELNPRWQRSAEYNRMFLQAQQNYMNDLLQTRGHVFLNEVYDALGMDHTEAGAVVGWVRDNPNGDNFIDFGIFNSDREVVREFVNGREVSILLDFNVDGLIYNLI